MVTIFDRFTNDMIVWCRTEDETVRLFGILHAHGYKWGNGSLLISEKPPVFSAGTCFTNRVSYGDYDLHISSERLMKQYPKIVPLEEFLALIGVSDDTSTSTSTAAWL